MNWYVDQVRSGHEIEIANKCKNLISINALQECFIPEYVCKKRFLGQWHDIKSIMFRGYIFMITTDIDLLISELNKIYDFTKIIGKKKAEIYSLDEEEIMFLKSFGKENHIVDMSVGYIEGENVYVMRGPLQGKEGLIKKIDRHKKIAYLQINMFNKDLLTKVGLEIISKNY